MKKLKRGNNDLNALNLWDFNPVEWEQETKILKRTCLSICLYEQGAFGGGGANGGGEGVVEGEYVEVDKNFKEYVEVDKNLNGNWERV